MYLSVKNIMKKNLSLALLTFCFSIHAYSEMPGPVVVSPQPVPPIACFYQTSIQEVKLDHSESAQLPAHDASTDWYLWRTETQIEIQDTRSSQGEIWHRLKGGTVEYSWLDHKNRFRVNYPPSDLKATRSNHLWVNRATLISPTLLKYLEKQEATDVLGYNAERYTGRLGDYELEIIWLNQLSIPAKITQKKGTTVSTTELKEVYDLPDSPWKQYASDDYEDMDFADIGDNETHPVARSHLHGTGISANAHRH